MKLTNISRNGDWNIHVTVAAVVERNDRYLMVEEKSRTGLTVLNQPAGHVEDDETVIEAVKREIQEETGYLFEPGFLIGVYQWKNKLSGVSYLRFCYTGQISKNPLNNTLDPQIIGVHWLSRDEIAGQHERLRSPQVLTCINDYERGRRFPTNLVNTLNS